MPRTSRRKVKSRRIVVDACVGRAAGGEEATHSVSVACRDCLLAILDICHRAAMDEGLYAEWQKHRSRFASTWLVSMRSRGKIVWLGTLSTKVGTQMRDRVYDRAPEAFDDVKLVDCAIVTDGLVLSLDCRHAAKMARCCGDVPGVADVVWACPEHHDGVAEWLKTGAPHRDEWMLGHSGSRGER